MSASVDTDTSPSVAAGAHPTRHGHVLAATGRGAWRALITLIYLFLWAPILVVAIVSFDTSNYLEFPPRGFTLHTYVQVFQTAGFVSGFQTSIVVAVAVAALATAIGLCGALALTRHEFRGKALVNGFFLSPLLAPHIVLALALLLLFSPTGLTDSYLGLILGHLAICIPYAIRTTTVSLATTDTSCEDAARVLGASGWTTFCRVTLPLIRPGVIAGAVMSLLVSFDEAVISLFITGFHRTTLPVAILNFVQTQASPVVAALSVILIVLSVLVMVVIERSVGLRRALR